ncbi:MAG: thiosulfate oxidation carrier protein SoxY [Gallionella sp.]
MVNLERRQALKTGGALGLWGLFASLGLAPTLAQAEWNKSLFAAKTMNEALDAIGAVLPANSDAITLVVPEIAENGAVVPINVSSTLPNATQIMVFVDKNPNMLTANFNLPAGTECFVTTRVKMAQTANVIVLVKADGKLYRASKEVKVTQGGCGG